MPIEKYVQLKLDFTKKPEEENASEESETEKYKELYNIEKNENTILHRELSLINQRLNEGADDLLIGKELELLEQILELEQ